MVINLLKSYLLILRVVEKRRGETHRIGKVQTEYLIFTQFRPKRCAICRLVKVKIRQTTCFLELQNHDWGLNAGRLQEQVFVGGKALF